MVLERRIEQWLVGLEQVALLELKLKLGLELVVAEQLRLAFVMVELEQILELKQVF